MIKRLPDQAAFFIVFTGGVMSIHSFKSFIAAALQGQMKVGAEFGQPGKAADKFLSVSYTHLDVYKRQINNRICPISATISPTVYSSK